MQKEINNLELPISIPLYREDGDLSITLYFYISASGLKERKEFKNFIAEKIQDKKVFFSALVFNAKADKSIHGEFTAVDDELKNKLTDLTLENLADVIVDDLLGREKHV